MALSVGLFSRLWAVPQADRPNVVLILLDDLNDWMGCMGGHPQARTPNIDALAQRGRSLQECSLSGTRMQPITR